MFFLSAANTVLPRFTVLVGMLLLEQVNCPLPDSNQTNPVGPALASIFAIARLFALEMAPMDGPYLFNAFNWRSDAISDTEVPTVDLTSNAGSIWSVLEPDRLGPLFSIF